MIIRMNSYCVFMAFMFLNDISDEISNHFPSEDLNPVTASKKIQSMFFCQGLKLR